MIMRGVRGTCLGWWQGSSHPVACCETARETCLWHRGMRLDLRSAPNAALGTMECPCVSGRFLRCHIGKKEITVSDSTTKEATIWITVSDSTKSELEPASILLLALYPQSSTIILPVILSPQLLSSFLLPSVLNYHPSCYPQSSTIILPVTLSPQLSSFLFETREILLFRLC
jgi:hypothetical protein